ncbi:MAG: ArnT family glycosyltransferase, partial [Acidobacteriota bacterium]
MQRKTTWALLVIILLAAFFLYQNKLLDFPYYGDEVDGGDITARILNGQLAPFYSEGDGHEALYNFTMAPLFVVLGESVIASRWTSVAWAMVTVALMYVYGQRLFKRRRTGVLAAGLTAALFWPALYAHLSLRVVTLSAIMIPALIGLVGSVRGASDRAALRSGIVGGAFAGLAAYTYTSGRGFPAIVLLFLVYLAVVQRDLIFKRWRVLLVYLAVMGIVSVWLYVYLRAHPEFDNRIGQMAQTSWFFSGNWSGFLPALLDTLGMFTVRGEPNWVNNISGRPVFVGPEGILFYLGVLICVVRLFKPEYGLQLIVLGVHMLPSIITEHPPSWGRSMGMLPALILITVLPVEWAFAKLEEIRKRGAGAGWAR